MEQVCLSAGSIHLINDTTIPFPSRLKLCRLLWVSNAVSVPRKHQMLLNLISGQVSFKKLGQHEFKIALDSVIDFLNSKQLADIAVQGETVNIKPSLIQVLCDCLQEQNDDDTLRSVIKLGDILSANGWISSSLSTQFNTFVMFLSSWVLHFIRETNELLDIQLSGEVLEHIGSLLGRRKNFFRSHNAQKNALTPFCKSLLSPLLKLHYITCKTDNLDKPLHESLRILIEHFISDILFSKENMHLYMDLKSHSTSSKRASENSDVNRRNKKVQRSRRLHVVLNVFQDMSNEDSMNNSAFGHCLVVFFRLFLSNTKTEANAKVDMLQELSKMTCKCEKKCGEDILSCKNWDMAAIQGLLETSVEFRLYQPAVNQVLSENLLKWFRNLLTNLVNNYGASAKWISCIIALTDTDKAIIEPLLKSILLKCARQRYSDSISTPNSFKLVHRIVDSYVKVRQSVRLVSIVILVINATTLRKDADNLNVATLTKMVEEFGHYLGTKFSAELSPALVAEVWSSILVKIHEKLEAEEMFSSKNDNSLFLLVKFFASICTQSPIFALWDHLTVRQDLDKCLKLLETCGKILHEGVKAKSQQIKSYLSLMAIRTAIESVLGKYIIAEAENIQPGMQRVLFQDNLSLALDFENNSDGDIVRCLKSKESKYSFAQLTLLRMQRLLENTSTVSILRKCGRDDRNDVLEFERKLHREVEKLAGLLLSVLLTVEASSGCEHTRMFQLLTKFFPVIIRCDDMKICEWLINAAVKLIFEGDISDEVVVLVSKTFAPRSSSEKYQASLHSLLTKIHMKLSSLLPNKARPNAQPSEITVSAVLDNNINGSITKHEKEVIFKVIGKYLAFMGKFNFACLDIEHANQIFIHILHLLQIVKKILHDFHLSSKGKDILNGLVYVFLRIIDGKRISMLQQCQPVQIFSIMTKIRTWADLQVREALSALQQELVIACYRYRPKEAFAILKNEWSAGKHHSPDAVGDMISNHAIALVNLVSVGGAKDAMIKKKPNSGNRKRKLRDDEEICKKLKLSSPNEDGTMGVSQSGILSDLNELYKESCKKFKKLETPTESTYNMLSSCLQAYHLLCYEGSQNIKVDKHVDAHLTVALNSIDKEMDVSLLSCKLRFVKCCLQCSDFAYEYKEEHLMKLIACYQQFFCNDRETTEVENCLIHLLVRIPKERFQRDVLDGVLRCLRSSCDYAMKKCFIRFTVLLINSGTLEESFQGEDIKVSKGHCCRFIKCFLEALHILITQVPDNIGSADLLLVEISNHAINSILKVKWVKFQASEVCNILSSLHSIPLKAIYDSKGPVEFVGVFKTYSEVLHCILTMYDDVSHISALLIAAFRHLLKSATHLGKQKRIESASVDMAYKISVQCASVLEMLFQLVADKNKKDFSKCMSYLVADYVCIISSTTIVPFVKKCFTNAIYHLISMMDEYDVAMVRRALPLSSRDVFQSLFVDYGRNFKYKGFV